MSDVVHVSWAPTLQPATRFKVELPYADINKPSRYKWIRRSPFLRAWCSTCGRRRTLRNLLIREQAWYDPSWHCRDKADCAKYRNGKRRKLRSLR